MIMEREKSELDALGLNGESPRYKSLFNCNVHNSVKMRDIQCRFLHGGEHMIAKG